MTIIWREATKQHRVRLQQFTCTVPAPHRAGRRPGRHPRPYEYDVQKAIRQLRVPLRGADGTALLGIDDSDDLVAVAAWCSIVTVPSLYKIRLLAVARSQRGQGGGTARECLNEVLARIVMETPVGSGKRVFGLVDRRNVNSQRLVTEFGFARTDGPVTDPDLEMWAAQLP